MAPRQPITANGDGTFTLHLQEEERALMATIVADLRAMLVENPDEEMLARLFPVARPDDPDAEAEYRELVGGELLSLRKARLETVAELAEATTLNPEQLAAWLGAVNDIRLVLGTRLQVSEDDDFSELDEDDLESVARSAYWYLGWLLEHLVEASASEL
ncbi:DUF2017 family protein [Candidatus Poriferisocius sp.]|uniref:DUF2017 family protein n=1 Tax=Candidatus Poriferisocius sp. TaxID=3101276 RepID=UPI003B5B1A48